MNYKLRLGAQSLPLDIEPSETLLSAMRRIGAAPDAPCGGKGSCGGCRVRLLRNGSRPLREVLACQTTGASLMQIWIRERFDTIEAKQSQELQDQKKREILLPMGVRREDEAEKTPRFGIAFDLGTTTIAAMLWELSESQSQRPLKTASALNPQTAFGADVISRLEYVGKDCKAQKQMQSLLIQCMNQLMEELTKAAKLSEDDIQRLSAVGNTTMMHFLFGLDSSGLRKAPFQGETLPLKIKAHTLGLRVKPDVELRSLPSMGGHLGSDAAAVLLALRLPQKKEGALVLDIGTNGEVLLTDGQGGLWGCTAAAGPAFEGGNISCGMRGEPGAIEEVRLVTEGSGLALCVIGGKAPRGICGSGLIDAAAMLLASGRMGQDGRLLKEESVFLAEGVELSQRDIRQLQMAKGALAAAQRILIQKTKKRPSQVFLAGAFGSYIRTESARAIGLLPKEIPATICGNAAGVGASMILLSSAEWKRGCEWAERLKHIQLAQDEEFTRVFLEEMYFPGD